MIAQVEAISAEASGALGRVEAQALRNVVSSALVLRFVLPYRYRTPFAPAAMVEVDRSAVAQLSSIEAAYREISSRRDVVFVEGPCGVHVLLA